MGRSEGEKVKGEIETKNLNHIYLFLDFSEILWGFFLSGESRIFYSSFIKICYCYVLYTGKIKTEFKIQLNENIAHKVQ